MITGVIADDITGANDIGIMFAKSGLLTHVYAYQRTSAIDSASLGIALASQAPDIAILDTNSRLDSPGVAYQKVFAGTRDLQAAGCIQFYNKTCSVFRGNIGAEFDAMLDALEQDFAVVVLGFPQNGRTTINGIHYVHGKTLEASEFRNDPVQPMRISNLVEILQGQTKRAVGLVDHTVVRQGMYALRAAIESARAHYNYMILDVVDQNSLVTIAHAVHDYPVLCGSSALAEELPGVWDHLPAERTGVVPPPVEGLGILCAAGSLMPQTAGQIDYLRECGVLTFELNPLDLFDPHLRAMTLDILARDVMQALVFGSDAVLHTAYAPDKLAAVRAAGARQGLTAMAVSRLVSESLAEVVAQVIEETGQNRLLVAGGETSNAVCSRLNISGLCIWKEIQPGLPSCISLDNPPLMLVLKSGSFGSPDFFEQAMDHLRSE